MFNPNLITPKGVMALSALALAGFSYVSYHWMTEPILTPADVTYFKGTVKEAIEHTGKTKYLEITLAEQPHPFHCSSSDYPNAFKFDLKGRLGRGDEVTLGVPSSEAATPRHDLFRTKEFYKFVTMSLGDQEALALDSHNKSVETQRRIAPWFLGAFALICIPALWLGFRYRASSEPIVEILKAKKKAKLAAG